VDPLGHIDLPCGVPTKTRYQGIHAGLGFEGPGVARVDDRFAPHPSGRLSPILASRVSALGRLAMATLYVSTRKGLFRLERAAGGYAIARVAFADR
jgi:hypothetical protein